uniref:Uncharacterized protein n=1 Tax=Noctiluca scintillans TaxID=2966 RepID=A0A7S1AEN7_NOCSC
MRDGIKEQLLGVCRPLSRGPWNVSPRLSNKDADGSETTSGLKTAPSWRLLVGPILRGQVPKYPSGQRPTGTLLHVDDQQSIKNPRACQAPSVTSCTARSIER